MNGMERNTTQLQFFRFAAMLPIFYWHARWAGFNSTPFSVTSNFHVGLDAVAFFFYLSGMISSYYSYDREVKVTASGIFRYVLGKIKRVYPLYLVVTLYSIMLSDLPAMIGNKMFSAARGDFLLLARHLLLIQTWIKIVPGEYFRFSEVGWFLSVMLFLYILNMPLRAAAMRIRRACAKEGSRINESVVFAAILVVAYLLTCLYCWAVRDMDVEYWGNTIPISRMGEYIAGMALGYLIRSLKLDEKAQNIPQGVYTIIEIAALAFWFIWGYSPMLYWAERVAHWFISNLVLLAAFVPGRGYLSSLFRKAPFRYPGDISFEFFLIHSMVLKTFMKLTDGASLATHGGDLISLYGCMLLALMMAALVAHVPFNASKGKPAKGGK